MNKLKLACLLAPALIISLITTAKQPNLKDVPSLSGPEMEFTPNKGQWHDNIRYQADMKGGRVYLEDHGITYYFYNQQDISRLHPGAGSTPPDMIRAHAVKVDFVNANTSNLMTGIDSSLSIKNYYLGNDPSRWASGLRAYRKVNYTNLYEGINLAVYSNGSNMKYDFIVKPGASTDNIRLSYTGCDRLYIENGKLVMQLSVGKVEELRPYSYQVINGMKKSVPCEFVLNEQVVSFRFAKGYDQTQELIIDPTLIFSSYSGSYADNWGYTATYDVAGNLIVGGTVNATGYPVTAGAYQLTYRGGSGSTGNNWACDIAVAKFSTTGSNLLYATYLGGTNNEDPHSLLVDGEDNLLIFGITYSTNYPVITGSYSTIKKGGSDMIISKLNSTGTALLASTFVGGAADDGINDTANFNVQYSLKFSYGDESRGDIICDANNDYYVAAVTKSSNFPVTSGVIQSTFGGKQDAVLFKINKQLNNLVWSTFLGGANDDAGYSIKLDTANNIYIAGGTSSVNFPTTTGTLYPAPRGGIDGFVALVDPTGTSLLRSTYIGTTAYDQTYFVDLDKEGNVYLCGQTMGAYPVTSGVYSNPNSGQFIHKLNAQLTTTAFSTTFGTGSPIPNISQSAFLVDTCGNIYVSGWGRCLNFGTVYPAGSTYGLPTTANAFQKTTDGCDFYFFVLAPNAVSLAYATFFGGGISQEHVDGGTSRFDKRGTIYQAVCAGCGSFSDFPTTAGAYSRTNNSSNCNNGVVKLNFEIASVNPVANAGPRTGCAPMTVSFTSSYGSNATGHHWDFGDGSPSDTTKNATHIYTRPGTYQAVFYAFGACVVDTVHITIKVDSAFNASATANPTNGCAPLVTNFTSTLDSNVTTHKWNFGDGSPIDTAKNPQHTFANAGTYNVTFVASNPCKSDTMRFTVNVDPSVTATGSVNPLSGCQPVTSSFNGTAGGNSTSHHWNFGDGSPTDTAKITQHTYTQPGTYSVLFIVTGPCNTDTAHFEVRADTTPVANFSYSTVACSPEIIFSNGSSNATSWLWNFGDTVTSGASSPSHTYSDTGTFTVMLIAGPGKNCADTLIQAVNVSSNDTTSLKIPNVFTPNGDNKNDFFELKGVGSCHTYNIKVYNRWGKFLFESSDPKVFWDGKIDGTEAAEGVYYYLLEVDKQSLNGTVTIKR